ncbi:hypothetical protein ABIB25_005656 [Nakamurella sp. UYEF19]
MALTFCVRQSRLRVEITPTTTTYAILSGPSLSLLHDGSTLVVSAGAAVSSPTLSTLVAVAPTQPLGRAPQPHRAGRV